MDTRLGQMLILAGLVSPSQVEIALIDQQMSPHLRLGDILVLRGWLKQETVDYFADMLPLMRQAPSRLRLGEYCVCANLLSEAQVDILLQEQKTSAVPLGQLAVRRGWLKPETLDFFLDTFGLRAQRPVAKASEMASIKKTDSQRAKTERLKAERLKTEQPKRVTVAEAEELQDDLEAESVQDWLKTLS